jgi:hypothetical protein
LLHCVSDIQIQPETAYPEWCAYTSASITLEAIHWLLDVVGLTNCGRDARTRPKFYLTHSHVSFSNAPTLEHATRSTRQRPPSSMKRDKKQINVEHKAKSRKQRYDGKQIHNERK